MFVRISDLNKQLGTFTIDDCLATKMLESTQLLEATQVLALLW